MTIVSIKSSVLGRTIGIAAMASLVGCATGIPLPNIPFVPKPPVALTAVAPTSPAFGMMVIGLKNPVHGIGYIEALPVTADNKPDPSRPQSAVIKNAQGGLRQSQCVVTLQVCTIPDLAPGRYYLSRIGWTDDVRFDVAASYAAASKKPGEISRDNVFFTVPAGGVVYAGSYAWTGSIDGPVTGFSLKPIAQPTEAIAMQSLINTEFYRQTYAAWLPMIRTRISTPTPAALVQRGKAVGTPMPPPPISSYRKDPYSAAPENVEDGLAIVVLKNPNAAPAYVNANPMTFEGKYDSTRRMPAYRMKFMGEFGYRSQCYTEANICVVFDLAPGRYEFDRFGMRNIQFSLKQSGLAQLFGADKGSAVPFVIPPAGLAFLGSYFWSYEPTFLQSGKFDMSVLPDPNEKLALQLLLQIENFKYDFAGWVPIVQKRLDRLERGEERPKSPMKKP